MHNICHFCPEFRKAECKQLSKEFKKPVCLRFDENPWIEAMDKAENKGHSRGPELLEEF